LFLKSKRTCRGLRSARPDVGELLAIAEAALGHQQVEGVAHVFGGDRRAVGETGLGVEVKRTQRPSGIAFHLLRDQA
jgi:hypothetical protein